MCAMGPWNIITSATERGSLLRGKELKSKKSARAFRAIFNSLLAIYPRLLRDFGIWSERLRHWLSQQLGKRRRNGLDVAAEPRVGIASSRISFRSLLMAWRRVLTFKVGHLS